MLRGGTSISLAFSLGHIVLMVSFDIFALLHLQIPSDFALQITQNIIPSIALKERQYFLIFSDDLSPDVEFVIIGDVLRYDKRYRCTY